MELTRIHIKIIGMAVGAVGDFHDLHLIIIFVIIIHLEGGNRRRRRRRRGCMNIGTQQY